MKVVPNCTFCGGCGGCECQSTLTRAFEILARAEGRVSTSKPESMDCGVPPTRAIIDKLILRLQSPISEATIAKRLKARSVEHRKMRHKDLRWCYEIQPEVGTYLRIWTGENPVIFEVVTKPASFDSFESFRAHITDILEESDLETATITRIDLAVDYPTSLDRVLQGFDFTRKQAQFQFLDKGAKRTGIRIGKGMEKIQIYDKSLKSNSPKPMTRIEIQMGGSKLPAKKLNNLEQALRSPLNNPFDLITLSDIRTVSPANLSDSKIKKLTELEHVVKREGYFSARRLLNKNGNFERDYFPLLTKTAWSSQPKDYFTEQIGNFFTATERGN